MLCYVAGAHSCIWWIYWPSIGPLPTVSFQPGHLWKKRAPWMINECLWHLAPQTFVIRHIWKSAFEARLTWPYCPWPLAALGWALEKASGSLRTAKDQLNFVTLKQKLPKSFFGQIQILSPWGARWHILPMKKNALWLFKFYPLKNWNYIIA